MPCYRVILFTLMSDGSDLRAVLYVYSGYVGRS